MVIVPEDVLRLVRLQLGVRKVRLETLLVEELGIESADLLNLVAAAEERWGVEIEEEELAAIRTPADLFRLVTSRAA